MDSLEKQGISVGLYLAPLFEEIPMHLRSGRRYLFGEAKEDYFVKKRLVDGNSDRGDVSTSRSKKDSATRGGDGNKNKGAAVVYNQFKKGQCGMLDPTNHNATQWFKQIIKEEILDYASASFWLADATAGGGPPIDGVYTNNESGLLCHNSYAEHWAKVNREAIREAGRDGDCFFITNSAYGCTAKYAGCTSLGDYVVSFTNDNGDLLTSVLNSIINGGFSGLTHGHCAVNFAVPRLFKSSISNRTIDSKSREMICRWMEMTAFTALFRTHEGDSRVEDGNAHYISGTLSAYEDTLIMKQLARWSIVYVALSDYRLQLLNEASFKGYPIVRHPILHFPFDENVMGSVKKDKKKGKGSATDANGYGWPSFMLGNLLYVVPVMKSGVVKREVYLPEGLWIHLWTGKQVSGQDNTGKTIEISAPLGEPPVFIRDVDIMRQFIKTLKQKQVISTTNKKSDTKKSSLFSSFRQG